MKRFWDKAIGSRKFWVAVIGYATATVLLCIGKIDPTTWATVVTFAGVTFTAAQAVQNSVTKP
jgi:hypothetical protein